MSWQKKKMQQMSAQSQDSLAWATLFKMDWSILPPHLNSSICTVQMMAAWGQKQAEAPVLGNVLLQGDAKY